MEVNGRDNIKGNTIPEMGVKVTPCIADGTEQHPSRIPPSKKSDIRAKLPAERDFDMAVYGGLGIGATTVVSAVAANWVKYGNGKEYSANVARKMANNLHKLGGFSLQRSRSFSESMVMTTALMAGGIALLLPIKWAEDNKPQLVRWLHERRLRKMPEPPSREDIANAEYHLKELEDEPKQTWGSVVLGRAMGTAWVYGVMGAFPSAVKGIGEGTAAQITRIFGSKPLQAIERMEIKPPLYRYSDTLAQDFICSGICTAGLYLSSHTFFPPETHTEHQHHGPKHKVSVQHLAAMPQENCEKAIS